MELRKLKISLKRKRIVKFNKGYNAESLLASIKKERLYEGIDWREQDIQDFSKTKVKLWIFGINRPAYAEEVIEAIKLKHPALRKPPKELGLCLLKRYPTKRYDPPLVLLHDAIKHPEKEFPHVSVLSGSRLSGARIGNKNPFHQDCLFVFCRFYE